jgi:4-amino-4-deoxy-L-arabinose transferase-like glycosyltransferase
MMDRRRFWLAVAGVTLVGFALRVVYALVADVPHGFGDDLWFHEVANGLADGRGFSDPFHSIAPSGAIVFGLGGKAIATAFHPPLFPAMLALASVVGLDTYTAHQIVGCALAASALPVMALVGRRLAGEWAGLAAAAIGAVFIPFMARESLLLSEAVYTPLIALTLLAVLRLRERPDARRALELGALIGLAALTRGEALLLVVLLAIPAAWAAAASRGDRLRLAALACAGTVVICLPWCVRNTLEFDRPTLITTGDGTTVAGSNLPSTFHGPLLGSWDFTAMARSPAGRDPDPNEAIQSERLRDQGVDYAVHHASRLPVVVMARIGRTWELYPFDPGTRFSLAHDQFQHIRTLEYPAQVELIAVWILAVFGGVLLRRRGEPIWPFVAPIVLVTLVTVLGHGDPRYRHAADVAIVILAGVGLAGMKGRPWARLSRS